MTECFQGYKSSKLDKIMSIGWMALTLISMYVAMYWHFHLKYLKSPYSKYSALLALFTLPFPYLSVRQLQRCKRQIILNDTEIQVISDFETETLPYNNKMSLVKTKTADAGSKSIVLQIQSYGDVGVDVTSGTTDDLIKSINELAPDAKYVSEHISSKKEIKVVLGMIGFALAVISGWFVAVYLATR